MNSPTKPSFLSARVNENDNALIAPPSARARLRNCRSSSWYPGLNEAASLGARNNVKSGGCSIEVAIADGYDTAICPYLVIEKGQNECFAIQDAAHSNDRGSQLVWILSSQRSIACNSKCLPLVLRVDDKWFSGL